MGDFLRLLQPAFVESANFLTWAFFSLVAAFYLESSINFKAFTIKKVVYIAFFIILLFIAAINILYIYEVFRSKSGSSFIANIVYGLCLFLLVANAGLVVHGIAKKTKEKVL